MSYVDVVTHHFEVLWRWARTGENFSWPELRQQLNSNTKTWLEFLRLDLNTHPHLPTDKHLWKRDFDRVEMLELAFAWQKVLAYVESLFSPRQGNKGIRLGFCRCPKGSGSDQFDGLSEWFARHFRHGKVWKRHWDVQHLLYLEISQLSLGERHIRPQRAREVKRRITRHVLAFGRDLQRWVALSKPE